MLGAGAVEHAEAPVPHPHRAPGDGRVAQPAEGAAGRHEPRAHRRHAGDRHGEQRGREHGHGHSGAATGELRAHEHLLGGDDVGRPARELVPDVARVAGRGSDDDPVAEAGELPRRRARLPVVGEVRLRAAIVPVGGVDPGDRLGADRLDLGTQHGVGEHADVVAAGDERPGDGEHGRDDAAALGDREEERAHARGPPV